MSFENRTESLETLEIHLILENLEAGDTLIDEWLKNCDNVHQFDNALKLYQDALRRASDPDKLSKIAQKLSQSVIRLWSLLERCEVCRTDVNGFFAAKIFCKQVVFLLTSAGIVIPENTVDAERSLIPHRLRSERET